MLAWVAFSSLFFCPGVEGALDSISPPSGLPLQTLGLYLIVKCLIAREHWSTLCTGAGWAKVESGGVEMLSAALGSL